MASKQRKLGKLNQLSILKAIRKPATPSGNQHGGRAIPRPTKNEVYRESIDDEINDLYIDKDEDSDTNEES